MAINMLHDPLPKGKQRPKADELHRVARRPGETSSFAWLHTPKLIGALRIDEVWISEHAST